MIVERLSLQTIGVLHQIPKTKRVGQIITGIWLTLQLLGWVK